MTEIIRERTLDASPEQVWSVVEPVERLPEWFTGSQTAELLSGQGLGRRQRLGGQWGHRRFEIDQTVIAYEPHRLLAWQHDTESLDGKPAPKISQRTELRIEIEPAGSGSRVRLVSRQLPGNVFKGLILRLVAGHKIAGMMEDSLNRLADILARASRNNDKAV